MKYLVMLCDGMADEPNAQLDNSTPMAKAVKPCMDYLASKGEVGMVKTVAEGLKPGSDVANLSVLGYEPAVYYSGRSPLEAASIPITEIRAAIAPTTAKAGLAAITAHNAFAAPVAAVNAGESISTAPFIRLMVLIAVLRVLSAAKNTSTDFAIVPKFLVSQVSAEIIFGMLCTASSPNFATN